MEEKENGCADIFIILLCIFGGAWVLMRSWNDLAPFFLGEVNKIKQGDTPDNENNQQ